MVIPTGPLAVIPAKAGIQERCGLSGLAPIRLRSGYGTPCGEGRLFAAMTVCGMLLLSCQVKAYSYHVKQDGGIILLVSSSHKMAAMLEYADMSIE